MMMHAQAVHPSRDRSELARTLSPQYGSVYGPAGIANPVGEPWFALGKDIFQTILEEALSETTSSKAPEVKNSSGPETKIATKKDTGSYMRPSNDSPPTSNGLLGPHTELVKLLTSDEKNKRAPPSELVKLLTTESENRSLQAGFQKQSGSTVIYSADQTSREIGLLQSHATPTSTPTSEVVNPCQNVDRVPYEKISSLRRDATPYSRPTIHSGNSWRSSFAGLPSGMQSLHNKTSLQLTDTLHRESLLRKRFADSSRQKPDADPKSPATEKNVFTNTLVCGRDMNSPVQHPQSPIKKSLKRRINGQTSNTELNGKYCFDHKNIPLSFSRNSWEQQVLKQSSSSNTGLLGCSMPLKSSSEGYETDRHVTGVQSRHQATDDGGLRCSGPGSSPRISPTEDLGRRFETGSPECLSQPRTPVDSKLLLKSGWAQIDKDVLTGIVEHLSITCLQDNNNSNLNGPRQSNTKPGTLDLSMPKPDNCSPYSCHRQISPEGETHEALDYSLKRSNACSVSKSERKRRHSTTACDRSDIENVRANFNSHPPVKFQTTKSCDAFETSTKIVFPRVKDNLRRSTSGRNELWGVVNKSVIHDMVEYLLMTLFPVETSSENGSGKVLKAVDNSMEGVVGGGRAGNCDRLPDLPRKEGVDPSTNISSIPVDAVEGGTHACKYPRDATSHPEKDVTQTMTSNMNPAMTPADMNVTSSPSSHSNGINCSVRKVASSSAASGSTMESEAISWKWKTNILLRLSNDQQNSSAERDWNLRSLPNSAGELIA